MPRAFHEDRRDGLGVILEILWAILAGAGIGLSLAAPPGPVNAIIASQTVTRSWRAGILVGMGAGEPFLNFDELIKAIRIMADPDGLHIVPNRITVSTAGIAPRIRVEKCSDCGVADESGTD